MSISSLYLDAFYACAKSGHFTKAAKDLHITQSALSQRIARLEEDLGTSLFIRHSKGIQLTAAGQELLRYCISKDSLESESLERLRGENTNQLTGVIKIGGFSSVMRSVILPTLAPLLRKNPKVKLLFISKQLDELPQLLRHGVIDYMIHYTELVRDEFETIHLGDEKNVMVEKRGYEGPDIYLDHDENDQVTARYLKQYKNKKQYERRYLDDVYGLIDGVKNGLGRAVIPSHIIKDDKDLRIVDKNNFLVFPVILHFYRQPYYSKLHEGVVQQLQKECENYLK